MLTGFMILKHSSLSQKMGFPKVQSVFKLDHFLDTMEMKSLKRNLALKITILHLLRDPMIFKEGVQSLKGIQDYTSSDWGYGQIFKEDSLHCIIISTLNDSLSLLKSVTDNF